MSGSYRVWATFVSSDQNSTTAKYTINGTDVFIDQTFPAADLITPDDNGTGWALLGDFAAGGSLQVELENDAQFQVSADAIRVEDLSTGRIYIVDDDSDSSPIPFNSVNPVGYAPDVWVYQDTEGYGGDYTWVYGREDFNEPSSEANWIQTGLSSGEYRVWAAYIAKGSRTSEARYTLKDLNGPVGTAVVNQKVAPDDLQTVDGTLWEQLTDVNLTGSTLIVSVANDETERVTADAIRIEKIGNGPALSVTGNGRFGDTRSTTPRDFVITNTSAGPVVVEQITQWPAGFEVVNNIDGFVILAPGESATISVSFVGGTVGYFSGRVAVPSSVAPAFIALEGSILPSDSVGMITVDNGDPEFSVYQEYLGSNGFNAFQNSTGFQSGSHYSYNTYDQYNEFVEFSWRFDTAANVLSSNPDRLTPDKYRIWATWDARGSRASDAVYKLRYLDPAYVAPQHGSPNPYDWQDRYVTIASFPVNQKQLPDDVHFQNETSNPATNRPFELLGEVELPRVDDFGVEIAEFIVTIDNLDANGRISGDAIRFERLPPAASNDRFVRPARNAEYTLDVMANDSFDRGVVVLADPFLRDHAGVAVASVHANADGTVTVLPDLPLVGEYSFQYEFVATYSDNTAAVSPAPANVTLSLTTAAPIATSESVSTSHGSPITIDLLANDVDPEGDPLSIVGTPTVNVGTLERTSEGNEGTFLYTPDVEWWKSHGEHQVEFAYVVSDGIHQSDSHATINVTNSAPVINTPADETIRLSVTGGVADNTTHYAWRTSDFGTDRALQVLFQSRLAEKSGNYQQIRFHIDDTIAAPAPTIEMGVGGVIEVTLKHATNVQHLIDVFDVTLHPAPVLRSDWTDADVARSLVQAFIVFQDDHFYDLKPIGQTTPDGLVLTLDGANANFITHTLPFPSVYDADGDEVTLEIVETTKHVAHVEFEDGFIHITPIPQIKGFETIEGGTYTVRATDGRQFSDEREIRISVFPESTLRRPTIAQSSFVLPSPHYEYGGGSYRTATHQGWSLTSLPIADSIDENSMTTIGSTTVALNSGSIRLTEPLDLDVGADLGMFNLVYNNNNIDPRPIIQTKLHRDAGQPVPSIITATLTIDDQLFEHTGVENKRTVKFYSDPFYEKQDEYLALLEESNRLHNVGVDEHGGPLFLTEYQQQRFDQLEEELVVLRNAMADNRRLNPDQADTYVLNLQAAFPITENSQYPYSIDISVDFDGVAGAYNFSTGGATTVYHRAGNGDRGFGGLGDGWAISGLPQLLVEVNAATGQPWTDPRFDRSAPRIAVVSPEGHMRIFDEDYGDLIVYDPDRTTTDPTYLDQDWSNNTFEYQVNNGLSYIYDSDRLLTSIIPVSGPVIDIEYETFVDPDPDSNGRKRFISRIRPGDGSEAVFNYDDSDFDAIYLTSIDLQSDGEIRRIDVEVSGGLLRSITKGDRARLFLYDQPHTIAHPQHGPLVVGDETRGYVVADIFTSPAEAGNILGSSLPPHQLIESLHNTVAEADATEFIITSMNYTPGSGRIESLKLGQGTYEIRSLASSTLPVGRIDDAGNQYRIKNPDFLPISQAQEDDAPDYLKHILKVDYLPTPDLVFAEVVAPAADILAPGAANLDGNQPVNPIGYDTATRYYTDAFGRPEERIGYVRTSGDVSPVVIPEADEISREKWTRDDRGFVKIYTDPLGRVTRYTHEHDLDPFADTFGNIVEVYRDYVQSTATYDPVFGKVLTATDARGVTTYFEYDRDLVTRLIGPGDKVQTITYGDAFTAAADLPTKVVDSRGLITEYTYDTHRRIDTVTSTGTTTV
ncbi:MAG: cadherin-like domain-containing protein, partial [Planctomycetota bacterium]